MKRIFFYGLFMDVDLLRRKGLHPVLIGPAVLQGYQIRIGDRASLVPDRRSVAYGMLIDLPDEEAAALYSAPDVRDYRAEHVNATLLNDPTPTPSLCYNLPPEMLGAKANPEYAEQLAGLVMKFGFPSEYAKEILR